jgi:serine/threonine protein kinase
MTRASAGAAYIVGDAGLDTTVTYSGFTSRWFRLTATESLHGLDVMHRDLKPENVLLKLVNNQIVLKLADFGFARPLSSSQDMTRCGSPLYMAPEARATGCGRSA